MNKLSTTIPRQKGVPTVHYHTDQRFAKSAEKNYRAAVPTAVRLLFFAALSLAMIGGRAHAAHVNYNITDLGVLPSNNQSYATRLNDLGQVVGRSVVPGGNSRGFLWQPHGPNQRTGTMYDLGLLSGGTTSMAFGINNSGAVSGYANDSGGDQRSVQWTPTAILAAPVAVPTILTGSPPVSSSISLNSNINNSGNIAATINGPGTATPSASAILWESSTSSPIGIPNTWGGTAINDQNQVAGHAPKYAGTYQAYRWTPTTAGNPSGGGSLLNMGDPGIGGTAFQGPSNGNDINALGDIVGNYQTGGDQWLSGGVYNGFLWENGNTPVNIVSSLIESAARGINDAKDVVGFSTQTLFARRAFIRHAGVLNSHLPGVFDLNPLVTSGDSYQNWVLQSAEDINNVGQIVGYGIVNGQTRGYLLTPIPEPTGMALALLGLVSLAAARCRV